MPNELKSCGVLVFRREPDLSFLLMVHPTRLDLPKGHVDEGETEVQCALRELVEETGIEEADIALDGEFRFCTRYVVQNRRTQGRPQEKTLVIFLGWLKRAVTIRPTEHGGHEWRSWSPPHRIQRETIDPLLAEVETFFAARGIK